MNDPSMRDAAELLGELIIEWNGDYEIAIREGVDITEHVRRVADRLAKDAAEIAALRGEIERARVVVEKLIHKLEGVDGRS